MHKEVTKQLSPLPKENLSSRLDRRACASGLALAYVFCQFTFLFHASFDLPGDSQSSMILPLIVPLCILGLIAGPVLAGLIYYVIIFFFPSIGVTHPHLTDIISDSLSDKLMWLNFLVLGSIQYYYLSSLAYKGVAKLTRTRQSTSGSFSRKLGFLTVFGFCFVALLCSSTIFQMSERLDKSFLLAYTPGSLAYLGISEIAQLVFPLETHFETYKFLYFWIGALLSGVVNAYLVGYYLGTKSGLQTLPPVKSSG